MSSKKGGKEMMLDHTIEISIKILLAGLSISALCFFYNLRGTMLEQTIGLLNF